MWRLAVMNCVQQARGGVVMILRQCSVAALLGLAACSGAQVGAIDSGQLNASARAQAPFEGPVPRAQCGFGAHEETDIQGRVSVNDRDSGRSAEGYWCNIEPIGQAGEGSSWQMAWYDDCAYYGTSYSGGEGVQVVDVAQPDAPRITTTLTSPAMLDPWESLKVHDERQLLGAVAAWNGFAGGYFDVYDVSGDCSAPTLLSSSVVNIGGHEGNWSADGVTYYGALAVITAIDVSDPAAPSVVAPIISSTHGLSTSDDGNLMYLADLDTAANDPAAGGGNGMAILDVSDIQSRAPVPVVTTLGSVSWTDGSTAQHTIPVQIQGHPYVIFVDEGGLGAARIIDVSDPTDPFIVSKLKLEVQMPENAELEMADAGENGFVYDYHYCEVDRRHEPTVLGCGAFHSGLRIFDIRDPYAPKEIAYYIAPANLNPGGSSQHGGGTAGYASSAVRFIPERGEVWFTDQDHGFFAMRFTNGVWPFAN